MTGRVQTCSFGDRICHGAAGSADASDGRSQQEDPALGVGVECWQSFPAEMQVCFAVDGPALESDSMACGKKGLLQYLIPFGFSKSVKVPEIAEFCPALGMSDAEIQV